MTPLEALIARASAKVKAESAVIAAEKKAKTAKTEGQRALAVAEVAAIRNKIDFRDVAQIFVVEDWTCACGRHGLNPIGTFLLQEHIRLANSIRMTAVRGDDDSLPRRTKREYRKVNVCAGCCSSRGYTRPYLPSLPPTHKMPEPVEPEEEDEVMTAPGELDEG